MKVFANLKISNDPGSSHATVQTQINKFRTGGVEASLNKSKGNKPMSRSTSKMHAAKTAELAKGKWRITLVVSKWLGSKFDHATMKKSVIYRFLRRRLGGLPEGVKDYDPENIQPKLNSPQKL